MNILLFYHSEVAKEFIECYKKYEDFGSSIKNRLKFNSYNWEIGCFLKYLNTYPEEGNYFISKISYDIFKNLSELKEFPKLLKKIFKKAEYFDFMCLGKYLGLSNDKFKEVQEIPYHIFAEKIREWKDPWYIANLLETLKEIDYQKISKLLEMLEPDMFAIKIKELKERELPLIMERNPIEDINYLLNILQELNYPYFDKLKELIK